MTFRNPLVAASLACFCQPGLGQIFRYDARSVPAGRSLETVYAFYVPLPQDGQSASDRKEAADLQFKNLEVIPSSANADPTLETSSIEVSVVRVEDFSNLVNPLEFCKDGHLFFQKLHNVKASDVPAFTTPAQTRIDADEPSAKTVRHAITQGGTYYLIISNCGDAIDAKLNGSVNMRGAHGYLPANEHPKVAFYLVCSVIYALYCLAWAEWLVHRNDKVRDYHFGITACLVLALLESSAWLMLLIRWNADGTFPSLLLSLASYASALKRVCSMLFFLATAMGWTVREAIGRVSAWDAVGNCTKASLTAAVGFYFVSCLIGELVHAYWHSYLLLAEVVLGFSLPAVMCDCICIVWALRSSISTMATLQERHAYDALEKFSWFRYLILVGIFAAALVLSTQCYITIDGAASGWQYHWIANTAAPKSAWLLFMTAFAALWAPGTARGNDAGLQSVYDPDIDDEEAGEPCLGDVHVVEDYDDDEETGENLSLMGLQEIEMALDVPPERIGATSDAANLLD